MLTARGAEMEKPDLPSVFCWSIVRTVVPLWKPLHSRTTEIEHPGSWSRKLLSYLRVQ